MGEAKWKKENPAIARQLAGNDRRRGIAKLKADGAQVEVVEYGVASQRMDDNALIVLEIGRRDDLSERVARETANEWRQLVKKKPERIVVHVAGYDEDPRELWDIPEVASYVRLWAELAGLDMCGAQEYVPPPLVGFLAACGVFGDEVEATVREEFVRSHGAPVRGN